MKWWLSMILMITVMVIILPSIIVKSLPSNRNNISPQYREKDEIKLEIDNLPNAMDIIMYDHNNKKTIKMLLEEYIVGVVAAEMPASFRLEALKAQAIASRTLAVNKMIIVGGNGSTHHPGADVCNYFGHDQAWISDEQQQKNWGKDYEENKRKIIKAVQDTTDQVITYNGRPIQVFFYSTSNGKTEDVAEVFSAALPYYGVIDSKGEEDAPKYHAKVAFSNKKFIEIMKSRYPKAVLTSSKLASQVKIKSYTSSGRVKEVEVGGIRLKGTDFRNLFAINSTDFKFEFNKENVIISTTGYGHGVGMSQVGADRMARNGSSYVDIIKHYYQGVEIQSDYLGTRYIGPNSSEQSSDDSHS